MIRNWYLKRKRAHCLGDIGHARLWRDPDTGECWQASSRYSPFTAYSSDGLESNLQMLHRVNGCELYVDPEDYGVNL